jgi:hypothetical protein
MGLIRKSLFLASGGIVAPNSKKQRNQRQLLAAAQGKSDAEVRRAGGRYEHSLGAVLGWGSDRPAHEQTEAQPQVRPPAGSRLVVHEEGEGWAPDAEYFRFVTVRETGGKSHRVPLGPDREPLTCWSCGEEHEKARRGFRFRTTGMRWDMPECGYLALAKPEVVEAALAVQAEQDAQAEPARVPSAAERLREVSELHDADLLTDAEYAAKRAALIEQL